jgi:hypothetical protein
MPRDELWRNSPAGFDAEFARHGNPYIAADAAIDEFGDADLVVEAFRSAPQRRTAGLFSLLDQYAASPGAAAALVTSHPWAWPAPLGARIACGTALMGSRPGARAEPSGRGAASPRSEP